jgi:hypothetical protein
MKLTLLQLIAISSIAGWTGAYIALYLVRPVASTSGFTTDYNQVNAHHKNRYRDRIDLE